MKSFFKSPIITMPNHATNADIKILKLEHANASIAGLSEKFAGVSEKLQ
jgi:hypothetical protein